MTMTPISLKNGQLENEENSTWPSPERVFSIWLGSKQPIVNANIF